MAGGLLIAVASPAAEPGLWACGLQELPTWAQELRFSGFRAQAQQLWSTGLVAPKYVGSSLIRDQTCVSCIGRRILYHWATREALEYSESNTLHLSLCFNLVTLRCFPLPLYLALRWFTKSNEIMVCKLVMEGCVPAYMEAAYLVKSTLDKVLAGFVLWSPVSLDQMIDYFFQRLSASEGISVG